MRKLLTVAAVAFVIWYIATQPAHASVTGTGILHWLRNAADGVSMFLSRIH